jgi:SSS family solute:Na+ symporter
MLAAAIHHGLSLPEGAAVGVKGGYLGVMTSYPSELAQSFWTAILAWSTCFAVTIIGSLLTRPRPDDELVGLVYSLTQRPKSIQRAWYKRPAVLATIVLALTVLLNVIFF